MLSKPRIKRTKLKIKTLLSHLVAKAVDTGPSTQSVCLIGIKKQKKKTYFLVQYSNATMNPIIHAMPKYDHRQHVLTDWLAELDQRF